MSIELLLSLLIGLPVMGTAIILWATEPPASQAADYGRRRWTTP
jgi:hypothetical protein